MTHRIGGVAYDVAYFEHGEYAEIGSSYKCIFPIRNHA